MILILFSSNIKPNTKALNFYVMILVTEGTGLLGRVIALELVKQGQKVRACKRPNSDLSDLKKSYHFYTKDADYFFSKI